MNETVSPITPHTPKHGKGNTNGDHDAADACIRCVRVLDTVQGYQEPAPVPGHTGRDASCQILHTSGFIVLQVQDTFRLVRPVVWVW